MSSDAEKRGRPSLYSAELANEICARLSEGESLNSICSSAGMPAESTVRAWALADLHGFSANYGRARELGYLKIADDLLDIADDGTNDYMLRKIGGQEVEVVNREVVDRSKLRVDTRKWILSKMLPKVYGDKITNEISGGIAVTTEAVDRPPQETREEWIARRKRELAGSAAVGTATGATNGRNNGDVVR